MGAEAPVPYPVRPRRDEVRWSPCGRRRRPPSNDVVGQVSSRAERGNGNRLPARSARRFLDRHDLATEWAQAHRDELEVRKTKRDPDDRQAEQDAAEDVNERQPPARDDEPDDVADR